MRWRVPCLCRLCWGFIGLVVSWGSDGASGLGGFALLTGRWRTLQHITASPGKIGDIARAALVLTHFEYGYIT